MSLKKAYIGCIKVLTWAPARIQFERQGYFCVDPDSSEKKLVFNRTVSLRDSWAKIEKLNGWVKIRLEH
ncbi:hypothetical protein IID10_11290 [candidate division KSB1 bacterium]|nr:hypothetical protein [candidate division KSB1 bacterium]